MSVSTSDMTQSSDAQIRQCVICDAPLTRHRKDAVYCGAPCRREAHRLKSILAGRGPYASIADRLARRTALR